MNDDYYDDDDDDDDDNDEYWDILAVDNLSNLFDWYYIIIIYIM